jgi:NADH dehydrogenase FAD-containing subunit
VLIDEMAKKVKLTSGELVPYDFLVLALGASQAVLVSASALRPRGG